MKKLIYTAFVICGMLTASCSDLLNLESKTDVTNNYLFTTPEGLNTVVTGLYSLARELPGGADFIKKPLYVLPFPIIAVDRKSTRLNSSHAT